MPALVERRHAFHTTNILTCNLLTDPLATCLASPPPGINGSWLALEQVSRSGRQRGMAAFGRTRMACPLSPASTT